MVENSRNEQTSSDSVITSWNSQVTRDVSIKKIQILRVGKSNADKEKWMKGGLACYSGQNNPKYMYDDKFA